MIWILAALIIVILDQVTKLIVISNISLGGSVKVIEGFFYLTHINNKGAAWGVLQNGRILFIPLTIIISGILAYQLLKSKDILFRTSVSFILGGAVGNLIDRVFRPEGVVDFFEFHFGSYIFPIFNVADSFVVVGTILLAYFLLFKYKDKEANKEE